MRNEKARRFLLNMRPKPGIPFEQHFPRADRGALRLLRRLLAFDPAERPTAEEALADPYFAGGSGRRDGAGQGAGGRAVLAAAGGAGDAGEVGQRGMAGGARLVVFDAVTSHLPHRHTTSTGLHCVAREPVAQPISKLAFEFDRRKLTLEDVRELIYREILEYHPQVSGGRVGLKAGERFESLASQGVWRKQNQGRKGDGGCLALGGHLRPGCLTTALSPARTPARTQMLKDYLAGAARANFHYPSALESFKRQFAHLEAGGARGAARCRA